MSHDDFAFEPVPGLPERLPEGERILWQGRPNAWALAWEALSLPWVAGYFLTLALWHFITRADTDGMGAALATASPFLVLGVVVCSLLWLVAFIQARATVYTVTNRRVAMRIGAALTLTLNLPFTKIASAALDLRRRGTGTIALDLASDKRLSYLVCWPHIRPWHLRKTEPALRCIPEAERIAALLADAADARLATLQLARRGTPAAAVAAE